MNFSITKLKGIPATHSPDAELDGFEHDLKSVLEAVSRYFIEYHKLNGNAHVSVNIENRTLNDVTQPLIFICPVEPVAQALTLVVTTAEELPLEVGMLALKILAQDIKGHCTVPGDHASSMQPIH